MNAIDKAREHLALCEQDGRRPAISDMGSLLDAIEEHYIELPTDADGEPLHLGDATDKGRVYGLCVYPTTVWHVVTEPALQSYTPVVLRHVQPDTWESIIEDAEKLGSAWYDNDHINMGTDEHADGLRQLIERCRALAGEGR